ncbi:MAG: hypothetical protein KA479_12520 [Saprospiraceae bacterium]|nr:hypothetical protein [Saprospiraceae bacterium]
MKTRYTILFVILLTWINGYSQCSFYECYAIQADCYDAGNGVTAHAGIWGKVQDHGSLGYIIETPFGVFGPFDYLEGNNNFDFQTSIEIGEIYCGNSFTLTIRDYEFQTCFIDLLYEPEHCCCRIENLQVDTVCVGPGEFQLIIDFNYTPGDPNKTDFWVSLGDYQNNTYFFYDNFQLSNLPITIGPFTADCVTAFDVLVNANGGLDQCFDVMHLPAICCGVNDCAIEGLVGTVTPCNEMEEYEIILDFVIENPGAQGFAVFNDYCQCTVYYDYNALPVILGPFPGDCLTAINMEIADVEYGCVGSLSVDAPCCQAPPEPCVLSDLELILSCVGEDSMTVLVDLEVENGSPDGFELWVNDSLLAVLEYNNLPYTTPAFFVDCNLNYHFRILDLDDDECEIEEVIEQPCCLMNIPLFSNMTIDTMCQGPGEFSLSVGFDVVNPGDEGWMLQVNEASVGPYDYTQLPKIVGPFQMDCEGNVVVALKDKQHPESVLTTEVEEICCLSTATHHSFFSSVIYRVSADNRLLIKNDSPFTIAWAVSSIQGYGLKTQHVLEPGQTADWSIPSMPPGVIFLHIIHNDRSIVHRIFVP